MERPRHDHDRTAYRRRRPSPSPGQSLMAAAVPLLVVAVLSEPLLTVLALEAALMRVARRRA
jgi:hypothetical protein